MVVAGAGDVVTVVVVGGRFAGVDEGVPLWVGSVGTTEALLNLGESSGSEMVSNFPLQLMQITRIGTKPKVLERLDTPDIWPFGTESKHFPF